jgi:hypothetical protein
MHFKSRPNRFVIAYRLIVAAILLLAPLLASATVLHVDAGAAGSNDGSDWANAYTDLQDALGAAQSGDEIWVATGVYKPTDDPTDRLATFKLKNEVEIYGGFAGTETARDERDWRTNVTVLSGDLGSSNSYNVVTATFTNRSALLDGFTITGGSAFVATTRHSAGGGMYNDGASPTLGNVIFSNNHAVDSGGGMFTRDGNPKLTNVTFSGNRAVVGGGMFTLNGNPELTNVTFSGNRAGRRGGGMFTRDGNPKLTNVTFSNNLAENDGGGMWSNSSQVEIHNTIFWNNRDASGTGTAAASIFNDSGASPTIRYSLVQGCNPEGVWNTACGTDGGGNLADADPLFVEAPDPENAPTTDGNVRLLARSPAVDAGNNAVISDIDNATDLDGNDRLFGDTVDLGPFETAYLSVTLSTAGTGSGEASVISPVPEPPRFDRDETVTVEALPDQGSVFVGWTGDLTVDDNPLAFTIEADTALTANFVPESLEVTAATANGNGAITPTSQSVDYNGTASFTVTPDAGWSIDSVTGNTCNPIHIGGTDWQAENITENCAVEAVFTIDSFTIGGTVSGLEGEGLELALNGGVEILAIAGNGAFQFDTELEHDTDYTVTVESRPADPSQSCTVANASGTINAADVTNIEVTCSTDTFTVGGTVSGLEGDGLILQLNGGDDLAIDADGDFTFASPLADGSDYEVTILTQPDDPVQSCTVANATGALAGVDVDNIEVTCSTDTFTIGGTVSGLEGSGLVLQNNGGDDLAIVADGDFTFDTPLPDGSDYEVTVQSQPANPNQTCEIAGGSGTLQGEDVADVAVTCATPALDLDLDAIAFGNLDAETEASGEVTLTNNGEAPVTISEITDPADPFAVTGGSCLPVPTTLEPGENCTIEVTYAPGAETAPHESSFEIISDAPSSPDQVQLSGHSFSAIPVPINRSATLIVLALLLLMAGWWRSQGQQAGETRTKNR